ncbi:MAG: hypothetical protein GC129_00485 [Proteobacteria bacterium]|nr:hypothetical protein [Pseudomonadota bacterium]
MRLKALESCHHGQFDLRCEDCGDQDLCLACVMKESPAARWEYGYRLGLERLVAMNTALKWERHKGLLATKTALKWERGKWLLAIRTVLKWEHSKWLLAITTALQWESPKQPRYATLASDRLAAVAAVLIASDPAMAEGLCMAAIFHLGVWCEVERHTTGDFRVVAVLGYRGRLRYWLRHRALRRKHGAPALLNDDPAGGLE